MKILSTIFFVYITIGSLHCQQVADSINIDKQFEILNECHERTNGNTVIDSLGIYLNLRICSIADYLTILEFEKYFSYPFDSETIRMAIQIELKKIANEYYLRGMPLILTGTGLDNFSETAAMNRKNNEFNIFYVATGGTCIGSYEIREFSSMFNKETNQLLGRFQDIKEQKRKRRR